MSNPSFSNIDLWLFELSEGNLSPEQVEQLELFLLNNPELDVDRDVWEMAKVDKRAIAYPNVADLERKRRPVAVYALSAALLLLLGTGSYVAWNYQAPQDLGNTFVAQNQSDKEAFVGRSKNSTSINVNDGSKQEIENNTKNFVVSRSPIDARSENSLNNSQAQSPRFFQEISVQNVSGITTQTSENVNSIGIQKVAPRSIGILNSVSSQTQLLDPSVTNLSFQGYEGELMEGLGNSDEVGGTVSLDIEPGEFSVQEGRIWNERTTSSNLPSVTSSSYNGKTFKDRLSKLTRSLERMMNSPIALKNSRDPHYHVPGLTSNDISFSSAGTLIATRVQATSRLQWQGKENEQLMNQLSLDGYAYGMRGGWGVQLNHQLYDDGGIQVAQAAFTYSPKISVSNWVSIEPSVRFKMGNKRLNVDQLPNTDLIELERGNARDFYANGATPIGKNLWYKDLGVGLLVNTKWFFVGVQTDNLFKHKDNLYDNNWSDPRRAQSYFTTTIGSDWVSRNEKLSFSPYAVYQKNEQLSEVWAGANFAYQWFNIGIAASSNLEPAASIGMKFDHFSLHYNADYTESKMLGEKALSHQLTVRFVAKQSRFNKQVFKR